MYVCICHAVTDREVIQKVNSGATSMKDLRGELNVGKTCGRCATCVKDLLKQSLSIDKNMDKTISNNYINVAA